jgi:hypothetical protein
MIEIWLKHENLRSERSRALEREHEHGDEIEHSGTNEKQKNNSELKEKRLGWSDRSDAEAAVRQHYK